MTDNEIYLRQKRAKEFQRKKEEQMKNENCEEMSTCLDGFKLPPMSKISSKALHNIHCDDNDVPWKGKTLLDNGSKKAKKITRRTSKKISYNGDLDCDNCCDSGI